MTHPSYYKLTFFIWSEDLVQEILDVINSIRNSIKEKVQDVRVVIDSILNTDQERSKKYIYISRLLRHASYNIEDLKILVNTGNPCNKVYGMPVSLIFNTEVDNLENIINIILSKLDFCLKPFYPNISSTSGEVDRILCFTYKPKYLLEHIRHIKAPYTRSVLSALKVAITKTLPKDVKVKDIRVDELPVVLVPQVLPSKPDKIRRLFVKYISTNKGIIRKEDSERALTIDKLSKILEQIYDYIRSKKDEEKDSNKEFNIEIIKCIKPDKDYELKYLDEEIKSKDEIRSIIKEFKNMFKDKIIDTGSYIVLENEGSSP